MLKILNQTLGVSLLLFFVSVSLFGQQMIKETPVSIQMGQVADEVFPENIFKLTPPDYRKALEEDKIDDSNRFALPVNISISPNKLGKWQVLANGDKIWKISIESENAKGWMLWFDNYHLAKGAKLFIYSQNGRFVKGAYSDYNNKENKKLTVGPISGSKIIVEYYEPKSVQFKGDFIISKSFYIYKANDNIPGMVLGGDPAYMSSLACMINVNCPEGSSLQKQKKGVVRILLSGDIGYFYCTGSLVNNTKKDSTPYILSAFHCEHSYTTANYDNYVFYFDWETPNCAFPVVEPTPSSMDGCVKIAGREESDFLLYKLKDKIPKTIGVCYNGWNKSDSKIPATTAMIHHPYGDVKKVSIDQAPPTVWNSPINWNNGVITPAKYHWRVGLDKGASQPGSSGAPLFDESGRIVGQLNGGSSDCMLSTLFYGKFSKSWGEGASPAARLKEWLDPLNLGIDTLSGINVPAVLTKSISGRITNSKSVPIKNVKVVISGGADLTVFTDLNGNYQFTNLDPNNNYTITPFYNTFALDGVSTADISLINKHILGVKTIDSDFKRLAADVNENLGITTGDLSIINKMILGKQYEFPGKKNWLFVSPDYKWPSGGKKGSIQVINLQSDITNVNFIAVKLGDVSGTN